MSVVKIGKTKSTGDLDSRSWTSLRIASIYAIVGLCWIFGTDRLLLLMGLQAGSVGFWIAAVKGTFFVLMSACLVGWLVHRSLKSITKLTELLSAVVDEATDAIYIKDTHGKYLLLNQAAADFVGRPIEEAVGMDDYALFTAEQAKGILEEDKEIFLAEKARRDEVTLTGINDTRTFSIVRAPFRDTKDRIVGLVGIARDVTERKKSEELLRISEARYRTLVEAMASPIFVFVDKKITFCNPAFVRLVGLSDQSEILGRSPLDFIHPDFRKFISGRMDLVEKTKTTLPPAEIKFLRSDGQAVPAITVSTPVEPGDNRPILVLCNDLTERERANELLRSVLASVKDSIITIDDSGIIKSINSATTQMFGFQELELIGSDIGMLMPGPHNNGHSAYLENYKRTSISKIIGIGREVEARRKDGTIFPAEIRITQFTSDGQTYFTGVMRDLSDRRRLEEQYHQAQKMEAVGRLAGGVAHDFNNLLTVINGYCDLILKNLEPHAGLHGQVSAVRNAGGKAALLTAQLLAFSRKSIVELKKVSLNSTIESAEKMLRRLIGEDIIVTAVLDPSLPEIRADLGQIDQIIMNLAVNARDAMPAGGNLTLQTKAVQLTGELQTESGSLPPGEYAQLSISDTGCGIPDDVRAKIFEPFFTTKPEGKGTGLGLAVVYGIVKQTGGHIFVESEIGKGTNFKILFPSAGRDKTADDSEKDGAIAAGFETILLVEDEPLVREIAKLSLESEGYSVLEAANEKEAKDAISAQGKTIQLLLTDVVMPNKSGLQLADEIRNTHPELKVLFMSGYTDDAIVRYGVSHSTHAFIQKPFTPQGLAQKVREVLDR